MKPAPFAYYRPTSLDEALALLERYGTDGRLLAGGQSLVPDQRTDDEPLGLQADPVEPGQAVDVDERGRSGQTHVERGDQALTARQDAAIGAVALEQSQGLVERGGPMIGELDGLHAGILP